MFQFTLPRGERPSFKEFRLKRTMFQFTLPRGERPFGADYLYPFLCVSIHAPAWGATKERLSPSLDPTSFNSRSRVGSDIYPFTNAPFWQCFNSRSRVGSDDIVTYSGGQSPCFNSRSRVGSDRLRSWRGRKMNRFNSRSRVGSDLRLLSWQLVVVMFQFTLPRGERQAFCRVLVAPT